jgi:hypothetical protein
VLERLVADVVELEERSQPVDGAREAPAASVDPPTVVVVRTPPQAGPPPEEEEEEPSWDTVHIARQLWWEHAQHDQRASNTDDATAASYTETMDEPEGGEGDEGGEGGHGGAGGEGAATAEMEDGERERRTTTAGVDADGREARGERETLNLKVTTALDEEDPDAWMWEAITVTTMPYA